MQSEGRQRERGSSSSAPEQQSSRELSWSLHNFDVGLDDVRRSAAVRLGAWPYLQIGLHLHFHFGFDMAFRQTQFLLAVCLPIAHCPFPVACCLLPVACSWSSSWAWSPIPKVSGWRWGNTRKVGERVVCLCLRLGLGVRLGFFGRTFGFTWHARRPSRGSSAWAVPRPSLLLTDCVSLPHSPCQSSSSESLQRPNHIHFHFHFYLNSNCLLNVCFWV